jgi:hypothetical protein
MLFSHAAPYFPWRARQRGEKWSDSDRTQQANNRVVAWHCQFGHVAIALSQPRDYSVLADLAQIEEARRRMQYALNDVAATAQRAMRMKAND